MEDGQGHPIAYASRTFTPAEQGYSQLEKEDLAVVFGVRKFHNFIYGQHFHRFWQPATVLIVQSYFTNCIVRIQRWVLTLSAYQYTIRHKAGRHLSNPDALSRLPRPVTTSSDCLLGDWVHLLDHLASTSSCKCSTYQAVDWHKSSAISSTPLHLTRLAPGDDFKPFIARKNELIKCPEWLHSLGFTSCSSPTRTS